MKEKETMSTFAKLAEKIKKELGIELINFRRCHVGYWQRSYGAWSWSANEKRDDGSISPMDAGSQYSATHLLKKEVSLIEYRNANGLEINPND